MPEQPAPSSQTPDGAPIQSEGEDFARAVLEDQLAGLKALADVSLQIIRRLGRKIACEEEAAEPDPAFDDREIGQTNDRTARALRLTYALQHVVLDRLRGVGCIETDQAEKRARAAEAKALQTQAPAEASDPAHVRKVQLGKVVTGILADAHEGDEADYIRVVREATERLRDHEVLDDVLDRPRSEVIADICRLLGLDPNWEGLAFEAWAQEERDSGKLGEPLRSPPPWMGQRPGVRGRMLKPEPPPTPPPSVTVAEDLPLPAETEEPQTHPTQAAEIEPPSPPPYIPPPDPDILPGYAVGLPGELPPERPKRRPYWV